jgi:hypothetical protein
MKRATIVAIDYGLNTARAIPSARWMPYDTGGHFLAGHDRELKELVRRFLDSEVVAQPLIEPLK